MILKSPSEMLGLVTCIDVIIVRVGWLFLYCCVSNVQLLTSSIFVVGFIDGKLGFRNFHDVGGCYFM